MYNPNPNDTVHPLLKATLHLDETFDGGMRHDLIQPFPVPGPEDEYMDVWREAEALTHPECEQVIRFWIGHRHLPEDVSPYALFFLCKRFDQASHFVQNMFLGQKTTIFSYQNYSIDEVLWWLLVPWWGEHGSRDALFEDLEVWERDVESKF
ncbi:MAG: hypothetical protein KA250_18670 [Verrucomicrobiales bacterium]|jgi:hypothetical protein|nr:hypothetical protein [Verrucomicrobiales bacterium]